MKKVFVPIIFLVSLSIIVFVIFTKASSEMLSNDSALKLGEEKYLKFLWMVDGAFNSDRFKDDFIVNDRKLNEEEKVFTCNHNKKSDECTGNNFESEFKKLFSKLITYEKVYSDEAIYSWIMIKDGKYVFNNITTCSVNRMDINHKLIVKSISKDEIVYEVSFNDKRKGILNKRDFVLILEDNEWKISTAFYHDLCGMKYFIY